MTSFVTVVSSGQVPHNIVLLTEHLCRALQKKKSSQFRVTVDSLGQAAYEAALCSGTVMISDSIQHLLGLVPSVSMAKALVYGPSGQELPSKLVIGWFKGGLADAVRLEAIKAGATVLDLTQKQHLSQAIELTRKLTHTSPIQKLARSSKNFQGR